jgi:hypothetical protein
MTRQGKGALATLSGRQSPVGRGGVNWGFDIVVSLGHLSLSSFISSLFSTSSSPGARDLPLGPCAARSCRFRQGCRQGWGWLSDNSANLLHRRYVSSIIDPS